MRPRRAAPLTPPPLIRAFLQNVANSCICHTSENSPVTPIIATDPKMRSCKPCVCHTCDPLPLLHFISFSSSFSRHESLATSKFPRSWVQICPFIFKQLQDAPPATLFFSCSCMVPGGGGGWGAGFLQESLQSSSTLVLRVSRSGARRLFSLPRVTSHEFTSHRSCGDSWMHLSGTVNCHPPDSSFKAREAFSAEGACGAMRIDFSSSIRAFFKSFSFW